MYPFLWSLFKPLSYMRRKLCPVKKVRLQSPCGSLSSSIHPSLPSSFPLFSPPPLSSSFPLFHRYLLSIYMFQAWCYMLRIQGRRQSPCLHRECSVLRKSEGKQPSKCICNNNTSNSDEYFEENFSVVEAWRMTRGLF